jgi:glycolate oxidase
MLRQSPDAAKLEQRILSQAVLADLYAAVGANGIILERNQLETYECDGLTALRTVPAAVVLPRSRDEVQAIVRICAQHRIPFVARGAGTGLSGGESGADQRAR